MNKLECDVIRDLLPSYVDGICSEATKRCVEEHLKDCPGCEQLMRQLRDTDFSANKLEQRQFDGYKKAKRQISQQGISGALLAVALVLSSIAGAWLIVHGGGMRSVPTYYVLLGICIACTLYFTHVRKPAIPMRKADWVMALLSLLGTVYLTGLLFYSLTEIVEARIPFSMEVYQFGAFVRYQLNAVLVLQMVVYGLLLWRLVKKQVNNGWVLCLSLTGTYLMYLYETYFGSMDLSFEFLKNEIPEWVTMAAIALGIGFAGIALSLILSRIRARKG